MILAGSSAERRSVCAQAMRRQESFRACGRQRVNGWVELGLPFVGVDGHRAGQIRLNAERLPVAWSRGQQPPAGVIVLPSEGNRRGWIWSVADAAPGLFGIGDNKKRRRRPGGSWDYAVASRSGISSWKREGTITGRGPEGDGRIDVFRDGDVLPFRFPGVVFYQRHPNSSSSDPLPQPSHPLQGCLARSFFLSHRHPSPPPGNPSWQMVHPHRTSTQRMAVARSSRLTSCSIIEATQKSCEGE